LREGGTKKSERKEGSQDLKSGRGGTGRAGGRETAGYLPLKSLSRVGRNLLKREKPGRESSLYPFTPEKKI